MNLELLRPIYLEMRFLSNKKTTAILALIANQEMNGEQVTEKSGFRQPEVSSALTKLHKLGYARKIRHGYYVYYKATGKWSAAMKNFCQQILADSGEIS